MMMSPTKSRNAGGGPSMRKLFAKREAARYCLQMFVANIWEWPSRETFPHFMSGPYVKDMNRTAEERLEAIEELFANRTSTPVVDEGQPIATLVYRPWTWRDTQVERAVRQELTEDRCRKYLSAFFSILMKVANSTSPTAKELRVLLDALNQPKHYVSWEIDMPVFESRGSRDVAEELVEYLRMTSMCGPVHGVCAECNAMFIRSTGERKFCNTCSEKHQTYQYRKEYLLKKKKEYYDRDVGGVRDALLRKKAVFRKSPTVQKGASHGKTATAKPKRKGRREE